MKKLIFTLILTATIAFGAWAKVITVSNDPAIPAQKTTVAQALSAAVAGDTIYLHGTNTSYGSINVTKINLTFLGSGYNPSKENPLISTVDYFYLDSAGNNQTGRGTKIIGIRVNSNIGVQNGWSVSAAQNRNVVISRCYLNTVDFSGDGWTLKNNVITYWTNLEYRSSIVISNNIFIGGYIQNTNQPTVLIANNLFYKGSVLNYNCSAVVFSNNILFGTNFATTSTVNSNNVNNNLTYHIFGITGSGEVLPTAGNTGMNNLQDTDPMFNLESTVTISSGTNLSLGWDFTLQAGSPALTASATGGEIGLYGGAFPWPDNTGMAAIPYVQHMNISGVVQSGGNINVDVKAKRHN